MGRGRKVMVMKGAEELHVLGKRRVLYLFPLFFPFASPFAESR